VTADSRDHLFTVPPERFVEEREKLARRLRSEGDKETAKEVKALRRPSLAVWTINRLAREREDHVGALLDAADRLQHGKADAAEEVRKALGRLVHDAEQLLEEEDRRATDSTLRTVASTLQAAAGADRDALRQGRLTEELEPGGFEAMAGLAGSAPPQRPQQKPKEQPKRRDTRRIEEALAAVKHARERERELRREADDAERAARRAHEAADRAAKELERAEQRLRAARGH
jgi:hypothetical protein